MNAFLKAIESYAKLSDESKENLMSILERRALPKGHLLVRHDTVCNHIYYVEKGNALRRIYFRQKKK